MPNDVVDALHDNGCVGYFPLKTAFDNMMKSVIIIQVHRNNQSPVEFLHMILGLLCTLDLEKNSSTVSKSTALIKVFECKSFAKLSKTGTKANQHQNDMKPESQYKLHKAVTSLKETELISNQPFSIHFQNFQILQIQFLHFRCIQKTQLLLQKFHPYQILCC